MNGGFFKDKEERNKFLIENCESCAWTGTYRCKMILNPDGKCMFYKEYDKDTINIFGGY